MGIRYLKFLISRALGTGVDTLVLWLLSHFIFGGGYWTTYILSPIISFECAVVSNFLCSYFWIWRERVKHPSVGSFWRHFVAFNLSSFAGFGVKMLFLLQPCSTLHIWYFELFSLRIGGLSTATLSHPTQTSLRRGTRYDITHFRGQSRTSIGSFCISNIWS